MTSRPRTRSCHAFTLIEMLVVVGIIALLVSILLPSLSLAKAHTRRTKCAVHQGEIGKSFTTLALDQDNYFSYTGAWDSGNIKNATRSHTSWIGKPAEDQLADYGYEPTKYLCPDRGETFIKSLRSGIEQTTRTSYYHMMGRIAVNGHSPFPGPGRDWQSPWTLEDDPTLAMTSDIIEKKTLDPRRTTASHGTWGLVEGELDGKEEPEEIGSQGGNVGYLDNSVLWVSQADMFEHLVRGAGVVSGWWLGGEIDQ